MSDTQPLVQPTEGANNVPNSQPAPVQAAAQNVVADTQKMAGQAQQMFSQAAQVLTAKPAQPQPNVTSEEKVWAALSYVPMVALLSLLVQSKSAFVKLHAKQGLLIFIIFFLSIFLYILYPIGSFFGELIHLALIIVGIYSLLQAILGNWWKIPVLGDIAAKLPVDALTSVATQAVTGQAPIENANPNSDNLNPTK